MNISILLDSRRMGGIETHVQQLALALQQYGMQVQVVFWRQYDTHPLRIALAKQGIDCVVLNGTPQGLLRYLRQIKPKVLHTHGYKAGIWGRLCGRLLKLPVVSTFHNGDQGKGKLRLYLWLDRILAGLSMNICVSDAIASRLRWPNRVLPNFVEHMQVSAMPRQQFAARLAFVGRLSYEKAPERFCALAQLMPHTECYVYGAGEWRPTETPSAANLHWMGAVPSMEAYWDTIDVLCIPSREEGLPMVALEALARGIYVVAFDVGDLAKVVRPAGGAVLPPDNLIAMHQAIQRWLDSRIEHKIALSLRAIHYINRHHTPAQCLPDVLSLYQQSVVERT